MEKHHQTTAKQRKEKKQTQKSEGQADVLNHGGASKQRQAITTRGRTALSQKWCRGGEAEALPLLAL